MPRGGHNRKPRKTKILQGTFRDDRNPAREPEPPVVPKLPAPPASMNHWACGLWREIVGDLKDQGLLTTLDLASLQLLCEAFGDFEEAKQALFYPVNPRTGKRVRRTLEQYLSGIEPWVRAAELKKMTTADLSVLRRNSQTAPELTQRNRAYALFKSYLTEFGLSPASRNRISVPKPKESDEDPVEKMLNEA